LRLVVSCQGGSFGCAFIEAPGYVESTDAFQRRRAFGHFANAGGPGERRMPFYLTRFSYTPETWARLVENPEDRRAAAQQYIESVGGRLHGFWYAFGDHDAYNLWEAPDNVSMAATAIAISAGGALSSLHTTVLLTVEETVAALQQAASIKYRRPGQKG
jgi:uncharacterized protein with GYD domain